MNTLLKRIQINYYMRCTRPVPATSSMELDELLLERGAVALCPHTTWRAQLLDHVRVPEAGMRTNKVNMYVRAPSPVGTWN